MMLFTIPIDFDFVLRIFEIVRLNCVAVDLRSVVCVW